MKNIELVQCLRRLRRNTVSDSVSVNFLESNAQSSNHAAFIKSLTPTTTVYLNQGRIRRVGVHAILRVLATNEKVKSVCLSNVQCENREELFLFILQDSFIESLEVRCVDQDCMLDLASTLRFSNIKRLIISSAPNQIGCSSARKFVHELMTHSSIRSFKFQGYNKEVVLALAACIDRPQSMLTSLCLEDCILDPQATVVLAKALRNNNTLVRLELHHNMVGSTGAASLADALCVNRSLKSLTLSGCRLGDAQATKSVAHMIRKNSTLTELNLQQNWIDSSGTVTIAQALQENTSLVKFSFRGNFPMIRGVMAISQAVRDNASLQFVDIGCLWEDGPSSHDLPIGYNELTYGLELNRAGRRLIRSPNFPLRGFVELLVGSIDQTNVLYGLLREVPHTWSEWR